MIVSVHVFIRARQWHIVEVGRIMDNDSIHGRIRNMYLPTAMAVHAGVLVISGILERPHVKAV